jgi:hypothetical protein
MTTLAELPAQRQEVEKQIANLQRAARSEAIDKIRALMAEHGLSVADVTDKPDGRKANDDVRLGRLARRIRQNFYCRGLCSLSRPALGGTATAVMPMTPLGQISTVQCPGFLLKEYRRRWRQ